MVIVVHGINSGGSNQPIRPLRTSPPDIDNNPDFERDCDAVMMAIWTYNQDVASGAPTDLSAYTLTQEIQKLASFMGFSPGKAGPEPDAAKNPEAHAVWLALRTIPESRSGTSESLADLCFQTGSSLYSVTIDDCFNYNASEGQNLFGRGSAIYSAFNATGNPTNDSGNSLFAYDMYRLNEAINDYQKDIKQGWPIDSDAMRVAQLLNQLLYDLDNGGGKSPASDGFTTALQLLMNSPTSQGKGSLFNFAATYLTTPNEANLQAFEAVLNTNGADLQSMLAKAYSFEGWGDINSPT